VLEKGRSPLILSQPFATLANKVLQIPYDNFKNPPSFRDVLAAITNEIELDEKEGERHFHLTHNYPDFVDNVLRPLSAAVDAQYRLADFKGFVFEGMPWLKAPNGAIVVVNGRHLLRKEFRDYWHFAVFVDAKDLEKNRRLLRREYNVSVAELARDRLAQKVYEKSCIPRAVARVIVNVNERDRVEVVRNLLEGF
jgi:hypothetical protein